MPLLKKTAWALKPEPKALEDGEELWEIRFTKEKFRIYEDYLKRWDQYRQRQWTCATSGRTNLTYEEALESERVASEKIKAKFPEWAIKPSLQAAHHDTRKFEKIVDTIFQDFKAHPIPGETLGYSEDPDDPDMELVTMVEIVSRPAKKLPAKNESGDQQLNGDTATANGSSVLQEATYKVERSNDLGTLTIKESAAIRYKLPFTKDVLRNLLRDVSSRPGFPNSPLLINKELVDKHGIQGKLSKDELAKCEEYLERTRRKEIAIQNKLLGIKHKRTEEDEEAEGKVRKRIRKEKKLREKRKKVKEEKIKFPIEDRDIPAKHQLDTKPPEASSIPTELPPELFGLALSLWDFINNYSEVLMLKQFSWEFFESAVCYVDPKDQTCSLLREVIKSLLDEIYDALPKAAFSLEGEERDEDDPPVVTRNLAHIDEVEDCLRELLVYIDDDEDQHIGLRNMKYVVNYMKEPTMVFGTMSAEAKLELLNYLSSEAMKSPDMREFAEQCHADLRKLRTAHRSQRRKFINKVKGFERDRKKKIKEMKAEDEEDEEEEEEEEEIEEQEEQEPEDEEEAERLHLAKRAAIVGLPSPPKKQDGPKGRRALVEYRRKLQEAEDNARAEELKKQQEKQTNRSRQQREMLDEKKKIDADRAEQTKKEEEFMINSNKLHIWRREPLGYDRDHKAYWFFTDCSYRIFVEDKERNEWKQLDCPKDVQDLLAWLNPKGLRELPLRRNVNKLQYHIMGEMEKEMKSLKEEARRSSRIQKMGSFLQYVNTLRQD
eukprot:Clim_evm6s169 gene=Clim_evmTU6s169